MHAEGEESPVMAKNDDETGAAILRAASDLLSAEGPGALSVRRIAAAAGCSTMGLYSRFGGKDGVVDELFAEGFEHLHASIQSIPATGVPLADLRACALGYRVTALSHATHYMVMFGGAVPGFEPSLENHVVAKAAFDLLCGRVQRCIDAGDFEGEASRIAEVLWGSMHGMVMLELVGIDPVGDDPAARYEAMLDTLLAGLRPGARDAITASTRGGHRG
jgi:AcrR family transcriptional regulator